MRQAYVNVLTHGNKMLTTSEQNQGDGPPGQGARAMNGTQTTQRDRPSEMRAILLEGTLQLEERFDGALLLTLRAGEALGGLPGSRRSIYRLQTG